MLFKKKKIENDNPYRAVSILTDVWKKLSKKGKEFETQIGGGHWSYSRTIIELIRFHNSKKNEK